ncbi:MAG: DUF481 domain-containing protein [Pseudomonadota bacterium]
MTFSRSIAAVCLSAALSVSALPVLAMDAPAEPALAKMLANAGATGDVETLKTTLNLALQTQPEAAEALIRRALLALPGEETALLDAIIQTRPELADTVVLPGQVTVVERREAIAAAEAAKPLPGFFNLSSWAGEITLGGSILTGNTEEQAISAGLSLERAVADWEYNFSVTGDYSRNNDEVTKQRLLSNFATKWFAWERGYVFGLLDFELDQFQLFDWRLSEAAGLGYRIIETDRVTWDVEGGPGARQTQFEDGGLENEFIFVFGSDYRFIINDAITFDNDSDIFVGVDRTTLTNLAALTAQLTESWSGRFSVRVRHDTSVPEGQVRTDTATRVSVVYGF